MNPSTKIQAQHLSRQAMVYIRQSTPKQVQHNQESTRRQYQLVEQAHEWGWPRPLIKVIDEDLGLSGASSQHRLGFQRLVAAISQDEVGLVTEISRLSRLNSDWHRVIELCAVFSTLIADGDGLYDPRDPNDRLLLGLKGTLHAAELHILQARMRENLLTKPGGVSWPYACQSVIGVWRMAPSPWSLMNKFGTPCTCCSSSSSCSKVGERCRSIFCKTKSRCPV
jgi:hypothetical protein